MRSLLILLALLTGTTASAACRDMTFEDQPYTVCEAHTSDDLRLFLNGPDGPYGGFSAVDAALAAEGAQLGFAMNAGMFQPDLSPVGLYIENGEKLKSIVTSDGPGNFGLLPNGVFCISDQFAVIESRKFAKRKPTCRYATQSGPMLVIGGKLHPLFKPTSDSLHIRNGVGVSADGTTAWFAISNRAVNFDTFARLFRDALGAPNALYFDGSISRLYAPDLGRSGARVRHWPDGRPCDQERAQLMARTRKGRVVSGWLVVDKPAGITSTAVVNKVKWALQAQKAGHAGTLDPAATGVLAVALGEATKTVPYITDALKCYRFRVTLGASTTTDDAEGTILATSALRPTDDAIHAALPAFRGDIQQIPPQFSAVKVDGERAYDLAREGEQMDLAARPLYVDRLDLIARPDADHVDLEMVCGKGGYVRSIARDLGQALGCLGHVEWLRREWSGPFTAAEGISMDEIERLAHTDALDAWLKPLELGLADLPQMTATPEGATRLSHGNPGMVIGPPTPYGTEVWASYQGRAIAVGRYQGGELHPSRVFV